MLLAASTFLLAGFAALPLQSQTITIDPDACQALTAYTPADDDAYKPGIDVHGNNVMLA